MSYPCPYCERELDSWFFFERHKRKLCPERPSAPARNGAENDE